MLSPRCHPQSFLLSRIIQHFEQRFGQDCYARLAVTAATSTAAMHLGGLPNYPLTCANRSMASKGKLFKHAGLCRLHAALRPWLRPSEGACRLPDNVEEAQCRKIEGTAGDAKTPHIIMFVLVQPATHHRIVLHECAMHSLIRLHGVQALIVDEASMLSGELFEEIERGARDVRGSRAPFGGIQLVLCGDFLQCAAFSLLLAAACACPARSAFPAILAGSASGCTV